MTVDIRKGVIVLAGDCFAPDAETLASLLIRHRSSSVDASACTSMHGAVLQALLAFKPHVAKLSGDAELDALISQITTVNDG